MTDAGYRQQGNRRRLSHDRWKTLEPIIDAAIEMPAEQRRAFLIDACGDDDELRIDAERLLAHYARHDSLFDVPAAERFGALFDSGIANLPSLLADRYRVDRELGRGGMASVYLAWDLRHERHVAIKVLHPHVAASLGVERFLTEIKTTARLQHPHILALHDSGEADGIVFYVMPYVEGGSLRRRLDTEKHLPIDEAVRITCEVASALESAHRNGVIHRDVKPENILLHDGSALVADFGIALAVSSATASRLTQPGLRLGTPEYMSPEQTTGDGSIDARSDVYALGAVLFEMLAGEPPFTGASYGAIVAKRAATGPPSVRILRSTAPPEIDTVLLRALAREPADRFPSAAAFADALRDGMAAHASGRGSAGQLHPFGRHRRSRSFAISSIVALAILGTWLARRHRAVPANTVAASDSLNSIAVLPLTIIGSDTADAYFADGMTDQLSSELGNVKGVRLVPGISAAFFSKRADPDFKDLGRKLNVALLLAGRVRREGTQLRVAVDLIATRDGSTRWTKPYSVQVLTLSDIYAVRDSIVKDIVGQLRLTLDESQVLAPPRRPTEDLEAFKLYVQGRALFEQRKRDALEKSLPYFEQAIARDPNFAEAYSAIADVNSAFAIGNIGDFPPMEFFPKARVAALRALSLNDASGDAHASLGVVKLLYDLDWQGAQTEFARALTLNPRSTIARAFQAVLFEYTGRYDEAVAITQTAVQIDPLSPFIVTEAGRALFFQKNYDAAVVELKRLLERDSTQFRAHMLLGQVLEQQGKLGDAVEEMTKAARLSPHSSRTLAYLSHAYALIGRRDEARRLLATLQERANTSYVPSFDFAVVSIGLGMKDETFTWLEKSYADHSLRPYLMDPTFDSIRSDRRYTALLTKVGLPLTTTAR